jgi:outer membrane protein TolC
MESQGLRFWPFFGGLAAKSQEPLSLRQAIQRALSQSPDAAIAQVGNQDAKASATLARTALLPQLSFTEDISAATILSMPLARGFASGNSHGPILR